MPASPDTTLLRLLHVRPVQKRDDRRPHALTLALGDISSELIDALLAASSAAVATATAATYIKSGRYIPGFNAPFAWVEPLHDVWDALASVRDAASHRAALARIKSITGRIQGAVESSPLPSIRLALWESLYAVFVAPGEDPRDRAGLIRLIRAVEAITVPSYVSTPEDARQLAAARPLVPRQLTRPVRGGSPPPDAGDAGPSAPHGTHPSDDASPVEIDALVERINPLRADYVALTSAMDDLERQIRRAGTVPPTDGGAPPADPPVVESAVAAGVVVAHTPSRPTGLFPPAAVPLLQPQTVQVIEAAGLSLAADRLSYVRTSLIRRKSDLLDHLFRLGGATAIGSLEPGSITLTPDDFDSYPGQLPFPEDFERPLVGSVGTMRPVGIGDLLILRETVLGYELGELAYIENVLKTELRSRVHRRLDRTETTYSSTTSESETTERDLTTNERFALSNEVERTVQNDLSLSVGLGVSASYGVVKVDANTDFAIASSITESQRTATDYSQEVTERAVSSLTKSLSETLTRTMINEVEETNTHTFDNVAGAGHIAGLYRFVDKKCQGQVFNYGKRLMMEFIVPEPAAFHIYGQQNPPPPSVTLSEPEPLPDDFGFKMIDRDSYHIWVRQYQVKEVEPPPPVTVVIGKAIEQPSTVDELKGKDWIVSTRSDLLSVPEGYVATHCYVVGSWSYFDATDYEMVAVVGRSYMNLKNDYEDPMSNETAEIPIVVKAKNVRAFAITIEVECSCTDERLVEWKIATWQKVVDAYNAQRSAWEAQLSSREIQQGNSQNATPPEIKQELAETELRKGCLVLLTNQHFASMDAENPAAPPFGYPEIRVAESMREGSAVQFYEQCFEWDQITYTYYPYFWGSKTDWVARSQRNDSDAAFADFLRAGAARVLVPVRPGYEEALTYYLETGIIWNGGEAPLIDDELYVSIIDELAAAFDVSLSDAEPYGDPWEYSLPTALVMLQEDGVLPTFTPPLP